MSDFWDQIYEYDAICCTTNSIVKNNGELVMGAGIAKAFAEHYPWLPKNWGERVKDSKLGVPGSFVTLMKQRPHLIYFQTKEHWKEPSNLGIITVSMGDLCFMIVKLNWKKVLLPQPGCGKGGLNWEEDVYPNIKLLLDNHPQIEVYNHV